MGQKSQFDHDLSLNITPGRYNRLSLVIINCRYFLQFFSDMFLSKATSISVAFFRLTEVNVPLTYFFDRLRVRLEKIIRNFKKQHWEKTVLNRFVSFLGDVQVKKQVW